MSSWNFCAKFSIIDTSKPFGISSWSNITNGLRSESDTVILIGGFVYPETITENISNQNSKQADNILLSFGQWGSNIMTAIIICSKYTI